MTSLINMILIMLTSIMLFLNHPLSMGLMILIQTFFICLISGMLINTYWFSYILFLTFLGGLLVLFIYVSSIASNELFKFSLKLFSLMVIMLSLFIILMFLYKNIINTNILFNLETKMMEESFFFMNNENKLNLSKLYSTQTYMLMFLLINYLLITLIVIVKITNNIFGPLRLMN